MAKYAFCMRRFICVLTCLVLYTWFSGLASEFLTHASTRCRRYYGLANQALACYKFIQLLDTVCNIPANFNCKFAHHISQWAVIVDHRETWLNKYERSVISPSHETPWCTFPGRMRVVSFCRFSIIVVHEHDRVLDNLWLPSQAHKISKNISI